MARWLSQVELEQALDDAERELAVTRLVLKDLAEERGIIRSSIWNVSWEDLDYPEEQHSWVIVRASNIPEMVGLVLGFFEKMVAGWGQDGNLGPFGFTVRADRMEDPLTPGVLKEVLANDSDSWSGTVAVHLNPNGPGARAVVRRTLE